MYRFFVEEDQIGEREIVITGSDVNHIRNVLRMKPGEQMAVSDGKGKDYGCRVRELSGDKVIADILEEKGAEGELPARIYLFQGLPKGDKMELIVQKAVELGVYQVIPVATRRAVVKLDKKKAEAKVRRCMERAAEGENLTPKALEQNIRRVDKARARSREMISDTRWGQGSSYRMTVNTTGWDLKELTAAVADFVRRWYDRGGGKVGSMG